MAIKTAQVWPGHCLIIPKAPGYASMLDLPATAAEQLLREVPRLARYRNGFLRCCFLTINDHFDKTGSGRFNFRKRGKSRPDFLQGCRQGDGL
jgi:hypothetical protein